LNVLILAIRRADGFTLVEAIVALAVLSLAMTQIMQLANLFVRASADVQASLDQSQTVLKSRHGALDAAPAAEAITSTEADVFAGREFHAQCSFDAAGRRCR
jgi:prepilin-type N-terminal cleavage/methylation domain-containing protein